MKTIYVTFHVKKQPYFMASTRISYFYAIKCSNISDAKEAASDVNSIDGVLYVRINKSGRLPHKNTKVILFGSCYESEL